MDKIDLQKIATDIQDIESSTALVQYLGKMWVDFETGMLTKNVDVLRHIDKIPTLLHKVARKVTPQKAYVCGVYSEKFKQLSEDYNTRLVKFFRSDMLAKKPIRNLFEYLHKNKMIEVNQIVADFVTDKTSEKMVRGYLKQLLRTNLVSVTYASEYEYYELTTEGYQYYYLYFRIEEVE